MFNKHWHLLIWCVALLATTFAVAANNHNNKDKEGYNIKMKINGAQDTIYLGYHYGSQIYIEDTFRIDPKKGYCTFSGKEPLKGGIYLAILMDKNAKGKKETKYFDFLVDNTGQSFMIETDTTDFVAKMKVTGSPLNEQFNKYQKFLAEKQPEMGKLKTEIDTLEKKPKEQRDSIRIKKLREKLSNKDKELNEYRLKTIKDDPKSMLSTIFSTMQEPETPKELKDKTDTTSQRLALTYLKAHFWDNVSFADERLVRTPILGNKITQYLENLTYRGPDSIIVAANQIIDKSKPNPEVFKFTLTQIMTTYENPKYMGMDAVFVNLAEKYYLTGMATWMDSSRMVKLRDRVNKIKPTLLGAKAPRLVMQDTAMVTKNMYDLKADYTVLLFWSHTCGHCKKHMPEYIDIYDKYKDKGVDFYSICTDPKLDEIKKFLKEYKVNFPVYFDAQNTNNFHQTYDIYSTPVTFVLDKDKKIVAKRLATEQLDDILEKLINKETTGNLKEHDNE